MGGPGSQFDAVPDSTFTGAGNTWFRTVASIGDFNADGFSDIAAKVVNQNNTAPRIHIYLGGKGNFLDSVVDHVIVAHECFALGDVNRDGFDDIAVAIGDGISIAYGGGDITALAPFGAVRSLRGIGDVNGDGFADVMENYNLGEIKIFQGSEAPMNEEHDGRLSGSASDFFGSGATAAGDVNGDGFGDILVGVPGDDTHGDSVGRAFAYLGGKRELFDTSPDAVYSGEPTGNAFGQGIAALGDINGDGFDDVAIRFSPSLAGALRLYLGRGGMAPNMLHSNQLVGNSGSLFGKYTSAADLNGDGFQDLIVGAPNYSNETTAAIGLVYVYFGGAGQFLDLSPEAVLSSGEGDYAYFGTLAVDSTMIVIF